MKKQITRKEMLEHEFKNHKEEELILSKCCSAQVTATGMPDFSEVGDDHVCTQYYVCTKCLKACDIKEF